MRRGDETMATDAEIQIEQRRQLYQLLMLKKENDEAGVAVIGLDRLINMMMAVMYEADVAYVEKMISKLK
ncbi:MAG: hypothetical protein LBE55_03565 [Clostridiales bacterium]|nr:hypothetical protein [Clostridiales bacterium]